VASHIENLERILQYILDETPSLRVVDILYERIKFVIEKQIVMRDAENFLAYFKFILSSSHIPKKLKFEPKLVEAFINRTYAELDSSIQRYRGKKLYEYLEYKLNLGTEIGADDLKLLEIILRQERKPTLDKLQEQIRSALILKWLQGALKDKLSKELQDYIIFLATLYGQFQTDGVLDVDWQPHDISEEDTTVIEKEFDVFKTAVTNAIEDIEKARSKESNVATGQEQFRVIFESVTNLIKMQEEDKLDSLDAFKDKLLVSTALIYMQDEFVKKDAELEKFVQLLISLYYQFRDKHYNNHTNKK